MERLQQHARGARAPLPRPGRQLTPPILENMDHEDTDLDSVVATQRQENTTDQKLPTCKLVGNLRETSSVETVYLATQRAAPPRRSTLPGRETGAASNLTALDMSFRKHFGQARELPWADRPSSVPKPMADLQWARKNIV